MKTTTMYMTIISQSIFHKILACIMLVGACDIYARTIIVTNTHNEGKGSLREAICLANKSKEASLITFALTKRDSGYNKDTRTWRIKPCEDLPIITVPLIIDGYSQCGSYPNCNQAQESDNACLRVELWGPGITNTDPLDGCRGLTLGAGSDCSLVKGLVIHNWPVGIEIQSKKSSVKGCFLGFSADGARPCANIISLLVSAGAEGTCIGSARLEDRNLIYGLGYEYSDGCHSHGLPPHSILGALTIMGSHTVVEGTTVGVTTEGAVVQSGDSLPHAFAGIVMSNAAHVTIGSQTPNAGTYRIAHTPFPTVTIAGHTINSLVTNCFDSLIQNTQIGTTTRGTRPDYSGNVGIVISGYSKREPDDDESGDTITILNALIGGQIRSGIVIGAAHEEPVRNVKIFNTTIGTDSAGNPMPNGEYGIHVLKGIDTTIRGSIVKYNGLHGICLVNSLRTHVEQSVLNDNTHDGINVMLPCAEESSSDALGDTRFAQFVDFGVFLSMGGLRCSCPSERPCACQMIDSCNNVVCC